MDDGSATIVLHDGRLSGDASRAFAGACALPELAPMLGELSVRIDEGQTAPVRFDGPVVSLAPGVTSELRTVALALREAIELQALVDGQPRWAHRIIAHATAAAYASTSLLEHVGCPPRVGDTAQLSFAGSVQDLVHAPTSTAGAVARFLERRDDSLPACPEDELAAAARALPFAVTTEVLLTLGGDDRQVVRWEEGVNAYGIAPRPMRWRTSFGSCTASAPTDAGFGAADRLRRHLLEAAVADVLDRTLEDVTEHTRRRLLDALGIGDGTVDVILTPSGTDAELVAAAIASAGRERLTSILVAPVEIGSGSTPAASGLHFSASTPSGEQVAPEADVDGLGSERIDLVRVAVRGEDGRLIAPDVVEAEIDRAIRLAPGHVLLHVVEGSKTGVRLPRATAVAGWQEREGSRLDVVVDAAQMRIDQRTVDIHLGAGRMVFVTGSKFFGGPPFSGAVLVPPSLAERVQSPCSLPGGLRSYLTENDVPASMTGLRRVAGAGANVGLLARWQAALEAIRSFHETTPEMRDHIIGLLAARLRDALDADRRVEVFESPYTRMPIADCRGLDDLPTIFSFAVRRPDGRMLDHDEACAAHRLLGLDVSRIVPDEDASLATQCFHLGQPVRVILDGTRWFSALRFAIGAETVSRVVSARRAGNRLEDCIAVEAGAAIRALEKLALIVDHVDLRSA